MIAGDRTGVVIVGGGIIGAATLWEFANRGVPAVLFESRAFANESTGKSAAIVRMHYSNEMVVRMALRSRSAFMGAPDLLGSERIYWQSGWLFLVDEADSEIARRNREMQIAEGSISEELSLSHLEHFLPGIRIDGIGCALFEEESGFANPIAATRAYISAARRQGAHAYEGAPVSRLAASADRVTGVVVDDQLIEADTVVLAAGAWSKKLAAEIGVELPMMITREQDVIYDIDDAQRVPFSISNQVDRIYLRPLLEEAETLLLVGRGFPKGYEQVEPETYDHDVTPTFEEDVRSRALGRLPFLGRMRMTDSRVGLYSVPPDWHPILGRVDGLDGLILATGGSGHSFKLAPAIAELVVGDVLGTTVDYADIRPFSLDRFRRGRTFVSTYGGNRA